MNFTIKQKCIFVFIIFCFIIPSEAIHCWNTYQNETLFCPHFICMKVEMGGLTRRMCGVDMFCHDELPPDGSRSSFTSFLRHNFREISFSNIDKVPLPDVYCCDTDNCNSSVNVKSHLTSLFLLIPIYFYHYYSWSNVFEYMIWISLYALSFA